MTVTNAPRANDPMKSTVTDPSAVTDAPATADMRHTALRLFEAGVAQADPAAAVEAALAGRRFHNPLVIAIGKAARTMAEAAMRHVTPDMVVVVTNYENASPLEGAEVHAAAHPVPDIQGARAALRVEQVLAHAKGEVLALISGGGSALLPAPVTGVTLEEKAETNRLLLASGADIVTMNLVRQHLSRLKGGGILRAAYPSKVTTLVLSDVVSDDFRAIASGPTVSPIGTPEEAVEALKALGVWDRLPVSVRTHLTQDLPDMGALPEGEIELIGSNARSVAAMARAAGGGVTHGVHVFPVPLEGDVADAAEVIVDCVTENGVYLFGGETTVKIKGDGLGGRNQELALRVAQLAAARGITDYVFLSGGTDGRDGPTDAAGGMVDDGTLTRMAAAGLDPDDVLARNDSYHGLAAAGDLLQTGATGTNVADLQVFIKA
ncbi:glycerate kinase type-2 family protein [Celeribacter sp.]|uniref:glycerate kinase type-2 family protein n=1 Tax=Celeribacter sp. TaxID=1890673 RepID=UPI003A950CD4